MQLEWKSNARYGQKTEDGSIFDLKDNKLGISIHHYVGCGDNWYLSCKALGIITHYLEAEDFEVAITRAKQIIAIKMQELNFFAQAFADGDENIFVRY